MAKSLSKFRNLLPREYEAVLWYQDSIYHQSFEQNQRPEHEYSRDANPETYLKLRDQFKEHRIRIFNNYDSWLYAVHFEAERHGISVDLLASVESGNSKSIDELCLILLRKIADRNSENRNGKRHLVARGAISDSFISHLIVSAMTGLALCDEDIDRLPRSLVVLLRSILPDRPDILEIDRIDSQMWFAANVYLAFKARGIEPTYQMIANEVGVAASTILRWFENRDFVSKIENCIKTAIKNFRKSKRKKPN